MDRTAKIIAVSTHSRPKAAGALDDFVNAGTYVSTHSRPKAAGDEIDVEALSTLMFQLTAARRRLADLYNSRNTSSAGFNSQPPEGGWVFM